MMHERPDISWSSDRTLRIGPWEDAAGMAAALVRYRDVPGVLDVIGGHESITLRVEAGAGDAAGIAAAAQGAAGSIPSSPRAASPSRIVDIPVNFDAQCAPDLATLAARANLSIDQFIEKLLAADLTVRFLGFAPGFAYITGLPAALHAPRLASPRTRIPAGSVAIGGEYLGIYPRESPGGWNIIGRTATEMFDAARGDSLLHAGDRVRLVKANTEVAEGEGTRRSRSRDIDLKSEDSDPVFSVPSVSASSPCPPCSSPSGVSILDAGSFLIAPQNLGNPGRGHIGVPWGGAADELSLRIGNRLLGNPDGTTALELTHRGGARPALIRFDVPATVAITGATDVLTRRLAAGEELSINAPAPSRGSRIYLCTRTGAEAPLTPSLAHPFTPSSLLTRRVLRVTPGPHAEMFTESQRACFFSTVFLITPDANRVGLRLSPALPMDAAHSGEMRSEAMIHGMIQVTPDGSPIVLGPDSPVTGGYPVIASIIWADLPALGQARPGERIRFVEVSLDEAHAEARARREWLDALLPVRGP